MTADAPVLPGETLAGKYRVERVLGAGGMGIVVAARHLELDERVAIKFLLGSSSEVAVARFLREARAAAKVKGEHVCRVFDFGRLETGEPYIVMEHLGGVDLARKLESDGPQTSACVVGWVIEACDALAEAHALGIIHRDLKPANLFLANRADGSTCAKVLDFGISKLTKAETMTGPTVMMGSPNYMSPEQLESAHDVDARSDIWSLGVMIYELLTGRPPFVGDSMVQLSVLVRERREEPLERVKPEVPERLARVVRRCLAKKREDRFASVAELAAALAPFAPEDVSPLVARLILRSERTAPKTDGAPPSLRVDHERRTFAPLQSTLVDKGPAQRARGWPAAVASAGFLVLGFVAARSTLWPSPGEVASSAMTNGSTFTPTPTPPPPDDADASTSTLPPLAAPSAHVAPRTSATEPAAVPLTVASGFQAHLARGPAEITIVANAAAPLRLPSLPTRTIRKTRDLDREDP